jgi:hypothetical protein
VAAELAAKVQHKRETSAASLLANPTKVCGHCKQQGHNRTGCPHVAGASQGPAHVRSQPASPAASASPPSDYTEETSQRRSKRQRKPNPLYK